MNNTPRFKKGYDYAKSQHEVNAKSLEKLEMEADIGLAMDGDAFDKGILQYVREKSDAI